MYCIFCGSDRFERRKVEAALYEGGKVIGTTVVEAEVCCQCGERYYSVEALRQLREEKPDNGRT